MIGLLSPSSRISRHVADASRGFSLEKIGIKSHLERASTSAISLTDNTRETWNLEASIQAINDDDANDDDAVSSVERVTMCGFFRSLGTIWGNCFSTQFHGRGPFLSVLSENHR